MTRGFDLRRQGACPAELVLPGAGDEQTTGCEIESRPSDVDPASMGVPTRALGYSAGGKLVHKEESMKRLLTLAPIAVLLAACEDAGNSGDDNLLTGGSLVLIVIIVVIVLVVRRRR
jgi:hypothetical protein